MKVTDEDIRHWLGEGWRFRVKTSHGKRYITRRKGGVERSLGPYSDELWNRITGLVAKVEDKPVRPKPAPVEVYLNTLNQLKEEVEKLVQRVNWLKGLEQTAVWKSQKCVHIHSWYGFIYCRSWTWDKKPSQLMGIFPEVQFKRLKADLVKKRWYAAPHPDLCSVCMRHMEASPVDEHGFDEIKEKVERLEASLKLLKGSAERRVRDDHIGCVHMDLDGYCTGWYWYDGRWDRDQKQDFILNQNGKKLTAYRDNVKKSPEICASCPSYEPRGKKK